MKSRYQGHVPHGIRTNNPGNLKYNPENRWVGQLEPDEDGFCVFKTPVYGLRAMYRVLLSYHDELPSFTPEQIVDRYTSDSELIKADYVSLICSHLYCDENDSLNFDFCIYGLMQAMIRFENGEFPYHYHQFVAATIKDN